MLKMYCQTCGALHSYAAEKPNFCQKCGTKFAHAKDVDSQESIKGMGLGVEKGTAYVPTDIQGLDIEIEMDQHRNTMSIGDIMKTADPSVKPTKLGDRPGRPEGMDIMQEFQREAGSIKKRPPAPNK